MVAKSYYDVLSEAVDELSRTGFDSVERVAYWSARIREAAEATMTSTAEMERMLREAMSATYSKMIDRGEIARFHQGVGRFTLDRVRPALRAELDRRIIASASLIRLNREAAIEKTLRRFVGWSTSIPKGGTKAPGKGEAKSDVRKALARLPFEERRVLIDQGHKLTASLSEILATDGGAIAGKWNSHYRQAGYNYREDHKERDGLVYAVKGSWAFERGLAKVGPAGWYDSITSVGEEPFCRCWMTWIYSLGRLPDEMLTVAGRKALAEAREKARAA